MVVESNQSRAPDFIGVGTQRSGTTWWFETLLQHPDVGLARSGKKELHYFERFCMREMRDEDVERYHQAFAAEPGRLVGEWTPRYMHDFWTPPLLRRAAPDAKLLVLLRDPVERFRSGVPHRTLMENDERAETVVGDAIDRGRYATQLRRLLHWHAPAQVLVLQYEKCVADPLAQFARTLEFLGADPSFVPKELTRVRGVSQEASKEPLWPELEEGILAALELEVAALAELTGEIDVALWPNFRHLAPDG